MAVPALTALRMFLRPRILPSSRSLALLFGRWLRSRKLWARLQTLRLRHLSLMRTPRQRLSPQPPAQARARVRALVPHSASL